MNNAIITGITGQDGTYLTRFLLSKNYNIFGVITGLEGRDNFDNFKKLNISEDRIQKIKLQDIQAIDNFELYDLAAQSSVGLSWINPLETFNTNVSRYIELLDKCKHKNVKIIHASSSEIYGDSQDLLSETHSMNPNNPYGLAKFSAHKYGQIMRDSYKLFVTNAILFNHESLLRNDKFITRKIIKGVEDIKNKKSEYLELGNIDIQRDWGFAEDYVEALWKIGQVEQPLDINIASGLSITLKEFVHIVFNYYEISNFEKYIKINPDFIRPTDIVSMKADVSVLNSHGIYLSAISENNIKRLII